MRGAESSVPREPRTTKGKPDLKGILLSMTVLSGRVSECPTGNLSVRWATDTESRRGERVVLAAITTN
jgi:hypothetical protein